MIIVFDQFLLAAFAVFIVGLQGCALLWKPGRLCEDLWLMVVVILEIFHGRVIHGIRIHSK